MTVPTSTYRIQFRNGMTFDRGVAIVPYLKKLGISHLYASPIFTATSGSTHGYDVVDANEIDPDIGGREGFERLVSALKAVGLGIIIDIVPNHMAASLENAWWKDVIENGVDSRYARHFDIDWSRRLTLPFLGDDFAQVLANGDISVEADQATGKPSLRCYDAHYPLNPMIYEGQEAAVLGLTDRDDISALHDRQSYRLMSWRDASRDLSYRRFFEVTGLVGIRVENADVFDDTHRLILDLVRTGMVDGLRVDHVDGLADPKAYLDRLRQEAGPECHITVEKILGPDEQLPEDWPVSGTTGYEFIAALSNVFVDNDKLSQLRRSYDDFEGRQVDMQTELRDAKLLMADVNFAGEFNRLLDIALSIVEQDRATPHRNEADLRAALRELVISFPVYRTYGTASGLPRDSDTVLAKVLDAIGNSAHASNAEGMMTLAHILREGRGELSTEFRTRFQQLTGPLMAKSVEDTLFYRQNMALALNEVGAEPLQTEFSVDRFHAEMATRLTHQPDALSATSTHDTKRGEDARARLYAITEAPELWTEAVKRWQDMNASSRREIDGGVAPEPSVEWMLYQALAGVWPLDFDLNNQAKLDALEERFTSYVEKALREAKLRTNWGDSNETYEDAVISYARNILSAENTNFLSDFAQTLRPFIEAGLANSLSQTLIKLTAPGVPDIYQGSESLDLSLVDPDNRRLPDFEKLADQLDHDGYQHPRLELKQHMIATVLGLRKELPDLFGSGTYIPLTVSGGGNAQAVCFARMTPTETLITIVPRLSMRHSTPVSVTLPPELANATYVDVLTGTTWNVTDKIAIDAVKPILLKKQ